MATTPPTGMFEGVVLAVHRDYAVVRLADSQRLKPGENVTFSLKVWEGPLRPEAGQMVQLQDVVRFQKGWRAGSARPIRL